MKNDIESARKYLIDKGFPSLAKYGMSASFMVEYAEMVTAANADLNQLLANSDRYQISIQFWPGQTTVYIEKYGVPLADFDGIKQALDYLNRVNQTK